MTKFAIHKDYGQRPVITYHLADAAEQRPTMLKDFKNRSRKQTQRPRILGIRGHFATNRGWISGIETGNGHCESGLQESEQETGAAQSAMWQSEPFSPNNT